jgi:hypothetical protein
MLDQRGKINTLVATASPVQEGGIIAPLFVFAPANTIMALSFNTVYSRSEPICVNRRCGPIELKRAKIIFLHVVGGRHTA